MYSVEDICAICGEAIEGRSVRCVGGVAHEDCLDALGERGWLLRYARNHPNSMLNWLDDHMSDDFLDEFWKVFREDFQMDIERWATR